MSVMNQEVISIFYSSVLLLLRWIVVRIILPFFFLLLWTTFDNHKNTNFRPSFWMLFFFYRRPPTLNSTYLIGAFFDTWLFNVFRSKTSFRFSCYAALNTCIQHTNTDHNTEHKNHIRILHEWNGFTLFQSQHVLIDAFILNEHLLYWDHSTPIIPCILIVLLIEMCLRKATIFLGY